MRFLIGVLTGGTLTWAASLLLGDYVPSPGPAFRWLGAQLAVPEKVVDAAPTAAPADVPDAPDVASVPEEQPVIQPPAPVQPEPSVEEPIDDPAVVLAPQPSGWESAWVPFETERSALGFAHVLTRELKHPFEVRREATHRYRVTFAYTDDAERERVLTALRSLTGAES